MDRPDTLSPASIAALAAAELLCRARGGRLTDLRRTVLTVLLEAGKPLGAYELLERLRTAKEDGLAPPTVYRSLDFLIAQGLVHRIETARTFVACVHPDHDHAVQFLICKTCGATVEAEDRDVTGAANALSQRHGFAVEQLAVEIVGRCAACQHA